MPVDFPSELEYNPNDFRFEFTANYQSAEDNSRTPTTDEGFVHVPLQYTAVNPFPQLPAFRPPETGNGNGLLPIPPEFLQGYRQVGYDGLALTAQQPPPNMNNHRPPIPIGRNPAPADGLSCYTVRLPITSIKINECQPGFSIEYNLPDNNEPHSVHLPFKIVSICPSANQVRIWYQMPNLLERTNRNSREDSIKESQKEEVPAEKVVDEHREQPNMTDFEEDEKLGIAIMENHEMPSQVNKNPEIVSPSDQPPEMSVPLQPHCPCAHSLSGTKLNIQVVSVYQQSASLPTQISAKSIARQKRKDRRRLERENEMNNGDEQGTVEATPTHEEQNPGMNKEGDTLPKCSSPGTKSSSQNTTFVIDSDEEKPEMMKKNRISASETKESSKTPLKKQSKRSKRTEQKNQRKSVRSQKESTDKWNNQSGRRGKTAMRVESAALPNDEQLPRIDKNIELARRELENLNIQDVDYDKINNDMVIDVEAPVPILRNEKQLSRLPEDVELFRKEVKNVSVQKNKSELINHKTVIGVQTAVRKEPNGDQLLKISRNVESVGNESEENVRVQNINSNMTMNKEIVSVHAQALEILNDKPLPKIPEDVEPVGKELENDNVQVSHSEKNELVIDVQVPVLDLPNEEQLPIVPEINGPVENELNNHMLRCCMKEYFDGQLTQRGGTEEMALLCTRYVLSVISVRYFTGVFHVRGAPRLKIENDPFNILAQIFEEIEKHPLICWTSHEADVKYKKYVESRIEFYKNRNNNEEEKDLLIFYKTIMFCTATIFHQDIFFLDQQKLEEESRIKLEKQYYRMMKTSINAPASLYEDESLEQLVKTLKISNIKIQNLKHLLKYLSTQFCHRINHEVGMKDLSKFGTVMLENYNNLKKDDSWTPENTRAVLEAMKESLDSREQTEEIEIFKSMFRILCSLTSMVIDQDVCIFSRKSEVSPHNYDHHKTLLELWFGYGEK